MKKICAFFGHRDFQGDITPRLQAAIQSAICDHDITTFWCGNYGNFDLAAARTVRRMQAQYPQIESLWIRAYFPNPHEPIHGLYDDSLYPDGLELAPRRLAISKRNEWIAGHCDMIIAYVNTAYGGAYTACRRASRAGKHIINLGTLTYI